jgi:hypothetical protein
MDLFERIIKCCCGAKNKAFCLFLNVFCEDKEKVPTSKLSTFVTGELWLTAKQCCGSGFNVDPGSELSGSGFAILIRIQEDKNYPQKYKKSAGCSL